jgi:hypothetical protein
MILVEPRNETSDLTMKIGFKKFQTKCKHVELGYFILRLIFMQDCYMDPNRTKYSVLNVFLVWEVAGQGQTFNT